MAEASVTGPRKRPALPAMNIQATAWAHDRQPQADEQGGHEPRPGQAPTVQWTRIRAGGRWQEVRCASGDQGERQDDRRAELQAHQHNRNQGVDAVPPAPACGIAENAENRAQKAEGARHQGEQPRGQRKRAAELPKARQQRKTAKRMVAVRTSAVRKIGKCMELSCDMGAETSGADRIV